MTKKELMLRTAIVIFFVEVAILMALSVATAYFAMLPDQLSLFNTLLSTVALTLISSPIIYYWAITPFVLSQTKDLVIPNEEKEEARQEADKATSEFISTVSHELRTPLTSIIGALGLIQGGVFDDTPEKIPPIMNLAYTNAERLHLLIDDILDIEKLSSATATFEIRSTNLSALVKQTKISRVVIMKGKGILTKEEMAALLRV